MSSNNNNNNNRKFSEAKTHEEKVAAFDAMIAKRRATLKKFITPAEQLKHGDHGVLVQIVRSFENPQVLNWFQQAEQDLGQKCMYSAMNFQGKDEEWGREDTSAWGREDTGALATRCIDLTLNGRKVRVAFYARDEDPVPFNVYTNYKIKYRDGSGEPYASILRTPHQYIYLLVIDPYYFDKTDDNWRPDQERPQCVLCPRKCEDPYGNNAQPLATGQCCQKCNIERVMPARMTDNVVEEILRENPNHKMKAGVTQEAYKYAEELYLGNNTRMDHLKTKACEFLGISANSSMEETTKALNLAKAQKLEENARAKAEWEEDVKANRKKNADFKKRACREWEKEIHVQFEDGSTLSKEELDNLPTSGPAWEGFQSACNTIVAEKKAEDLKKAAMKADIEAAKWIRELDRAPKEKKTEAKKQGKPAKKICSCGNKDCMPRPAKTAWVNGVKRDQTVLQNNWDRKHSA